MDKKTTTSLIIVLVAIIVILGAFLFDAQARLKDSQVKLEASKDAQKILTVELLRIWKKGGG